MVAFADCHRDSPLGGSRILGRISSGALHLHSFLMDDVSPTSNSSCRPSRSALIPPLLIGWMILFFVGALIRFHALDRQSLWNDEMSSIRFVHGSLQEGLAQLKTSESHPPLFFLQLRLWKDWVGGSLVLLRANSAVWGTLALFALFGLSNRLSPSSGVGFFTALLLAFSPFPVAYSQELRPYAMAMCLGVFGFWMIEEIRCRQGKRWPWFACVLVFASELTTHYWGSFVVLSQLLYGALVLTEKKSRLKWMGVALGTGLLFLFWVPVLRVQMKFTPEINGWWIDRPSPMNLFNTFTAFCGVRFNFAASKFLLSPLPWARACVLLVFAVGLARGLWKGALAPRLWFVVGLFTPYLLSYWMPSIYVWWRYPLLVYPAFLWLVVEGWMSFSLVRLKQGALVFLLLSQVGGTWVYLTRWEKANPKAVGAYVTSLSDSLLESRESMRKDVVIVRPAYFAALFSYYDQTGLTVLDQDKLDSVSKRAALKGKEIILLAFDVPSDPIIEAFRQEFQVTSSRAFPAIARMGVTVLTLE